MIKWTTSLSDIDYPHSQQWPLGMGQPPSIVKNLATLPHTAVDRLTRSQVTRTTSAMTFSARRAWKRSLSHQTKPAPAAPSTRATPEANDPPHPPSAAPDTH